LSDSGDPEHDARREQEQRNEALSLAGGKCPWSGLILHREGEGVPGSVSCDMCDCFGFDPAEVGKIHPRPLRVVRWKVTRKTCMECKRGFGDNTGSNVCDRCLSDALGDALSRIPDPFDPQFRLT